VDLLVPAVQELDQSVLTVRESQIELFREIERLSSGTRRTYLRARRGRAVLWTAYSRASCFAKPELCGPSAELQKFVEQSKLPNLDQYVAKLNNAKRRLMAINTTLKTVQERLDRTYYAANRRRAASTASITAPAAATL